MSYSQIFYLFVQMTTYSVDRVPRTTEEQQGPSPPPPSSPGPLQRAQSSSSPPDAVGEGVEPGNQDALTHGGLPDEVGFLLVLPMFVNPWSR